MPSRPPEPAATRAAILAVEHWLHDESAQEPERAAIGQAVKLTARTLAALAPGASVELRVPPFVAVQCISGPRHTRGTPPNVAETDPRTWLMVATGLLDLANAAAQGRLALSGSRAGEIADWLPVVTLGGDTQAL